MILAQVDEWFHASVAGIRPLCLRTIQAYEGKDEGLVFAPKIVGMF